MAINSPTGVRFTLLEVPDLAAVTVMGWIQAPAHPGEYIEIFEFQSATPWQDTLWLGFDLGTFDLGLELYSDVPTHDEWIVAASGVGADQWLHWAITLVGGTATLFVTTEDHANDVTQIATITNADVDITNIDRTRVLLGATVGAKMCNFKVFEGELTAAQIRIERDHWASTLTPWTHIPADKRAYFQAQTNVRDVSGNNRHLENLTVQGLGADVADPSILQYTSAGSVRKVVGTAATVAVGVTSINVNVPAGAYSSGNDVVRVNDALVLTLVHGGANYATVPAAWTLVQQGVSGAARLEVYVKNYGMLAGVPTAEVTPVAITGVDGAIGRIVAYGGMEHADLLVKTSGVKTGSGVVSTSDAMDSGTDWRDALTLVCAIGTDTNTGGSSTILSPYVQDGFDGQADIDMAQDSLESLFSSSFFAGFKLSMWDGAVVSHGPTRTFKAASSNTDPWVFISLLLRPHDQPFARRQYYSRARTGLSHVRTTDFASDRWDNYYYTPSAFESWAIFSKMERRKDRCGSLVTDEWTSNKEVDVAWHEYARPLPAMVSPDVTRLKVNYKARWSANFLSYNPNTDMHVKFRGRVFLTTSLTDLSEAIVLIDEWVSGTEFTINFPFITEPMVLPPFTTTVPCWLVLVWGVRFEDIPMPTVTYPSPTEWASALNVIGAGDGGGVGKNDGPESGLPGGIGTYAPWVEWSEHFLEPVLPAPPSNMTRATAIVIDPNDVPGYESGLIDTRGATSPSSAVWWSFTPTVTQQYIFHTFGSNGLAVIRVFNAAGNDFITALQVDDDQIGGQGCVSWWRGTLTAGVAYAIQIRRDSRTSSSYGGTVQLTVEQVETPAPDDIFVPAGNGNTIMVWRNGRLVNISAFNASGWLAGGVAIDYTQRAMKDYRYYDTAPETTHSGERLVIGMFSTAIAPGNDYAIILDLLTLNPNEQPIDYIFWGDYGVDPFGLSTVEVDQAGKMWAGSFGSFLAIVGAEKAHEDSIARTSAQAGLLAWDLLNAWYQRDFEADPPGSPELYPADYDKSGTNFIRLSTDQTKVLYSSSGFYVPVGGTKVKAITTGGTQLADVTSPITPGTGPNPGPKGICPLYDGGYLLCNGGVVQRYDANGIHLQTYTPTNPVATAMSDVDLTVDRLHFWAYDMAMARFYRFNLASGAQVQTFPTFAYPGSSHSFVIYRPNRFAVAQQTEVVRRKWLRRATHLSDEDRRLFHHAFELDLEAGVGNDDAPDPDVMLRWSDDGGHTWSNEHWRKAGVAGDFGKRVRWQRLGAARDRVYEVSGSDPVKIALIDAYLRTTPGLH